ncbi:MAG TPA: AAA family ATPase [Azospirillaceae bacterium]|nr:AAA family ATPase [Azospirillaceae bacterium]
MDAIRQDGGAPDGGLDIAAVIGALRRRGRLIAGIVAVGAALSVAATVLIPPRYQARAALLVEQRGPDLPTVDGSDGAGGPGEAFVDNQVKVLRSRETLAAVVDAQGLGRDPEFTADRFGLPGRLVRQARQWVLGEPAAEALPDAAGTAPAGESVFRRIADRLEVHRDGESDVVMVGFTSTDPRKAARIVTGLIEAYLAKQQQDKREAVDRVGQWLSSQADRLRRQVAEAEAAVEAHRAGNRLTDGGGEVPGAQEVANLRVELNAARATAAERQARLGRIAELRGKGDGYRPLTEIAASPVITSLIQIDDELLREEARLSETLGDRHPQVQEAKGKRQRLAAKMEAAVRDVIRTLEVELATARARERELAAMIEETMERSTVAGQAGLRLRELEREAASRRGVYEAALLRFTELQDRVALAEPDARVISPAAVPDRPEFPRLGIMLPAGILVSLIAAVALAALLEALDRGLRTGRQVEAALGLANLGLVPKVTGSRQAPHRYLLERPGSAYADAVQSILMRVQLSQPGMARRVVLVTSTLPGEGKTTLAMSLAACVAKSGRSTVVVDLDLRHPSVARQMGQRPSAGLIELVAGDSALDDILLLDEGEGRLHVVPVKGRTDRPTDVLASPALRALLIELRQRYEFVFLDAPPTLAFSDVGIAAQLADAVLFVVQWDKTSGAVAANGVEVLLRSRIPVVGTAVTQVDVRRHALYGYGDVAQYYGKNREYFAG